LAANLLGELGSDLVAEEGARGHDNRVTPAALPAGNSVEPSKLCAL
jgi:hypothetical protein